MTELTHFDESGASRMVDVTEKDVTLRTARASGCVRLEPSTLALVVDRRMAKGDVLEVARLAGIMAAKRTGELIPLCHPLGLDSVELAFTPVEPDAIRIEASVKVHGRTGVEMEALTAVSVAALTVYDMCKSVDRGMVIAQIQLEEKTGGRRGVYRRGELPAHRIRPARSDRARSGNRFIRDGGWEGWDVVTTAGRRRGKPAQSVVDVRSHRGGAGRGRADLPGRAGESIPVRATTRRSLCATIEASGCGRPSCSSRARRAACSPTLIPFWRRSSR